MESQERALQAALPFLVSSLLQIQHKKTFISENQGTNDIQSKAFYLVNMDTAM